MQKHIIYREESYKIMGACFEVFVNFGHYPKVEHERIVL